MIWGETGDRVAHASTRCIPTEKNDSRPEMKLILMSMEIKIIYGKHIPTGSRKSDLLQIYSA